MPKMEYFQTDHSKNQEVSFMRSTVAPARYIAQFLISLFSALSLGLPAVTGASAQDAAAAQPVAAAVTVAEAAVREVSAVVPISGTVLPRVEVLVTPQVSGAQIRQVRVDIGDWVDNGDLLIRLRRDVLEIELSQAEAEEARADSAIRQARNQISSTAASEQQAEADLERYAKLFESGSVSQASYDEVVARTEAARAAAASARDGLAIAEAQAAGARLQREIAEMNLSWTEITAPTTGLVGARTAKVGSLTSLSGEPLLTIFEGGTLELSADVIESSLGDIKPGDGGTIAISGIGPMIGIVRLVSPTVDPRTRLGEVRISLESDVRLRSGLFGSGFIETERRLALTVPITAVLSDSDGPYVQVVEYGRISHRAVTPGLIWQGQREIVSGLEAGETVIARAGAFFRDGDRVRPVGSAAGN
jgi:HlyD family secretion protein